MIFANAIQQFTHTKTHILLIFYFVQYIFMHNLIKIYNNNIYN